MKMYPMYPVRMPLAPIKVKLEAYSIPEPNSGCWLWMASTGKNGYGQITMDGVKMGAHCAAYRAYIGDIPKGMCVMHRCDTKTCVNPDHLTLGTQQDNVRDKVRKNRQSKGVETGLARLSEAEVLEIVALLDSAFLTQREIAARYVIGVGAVSKINTGHRWNYLTERSR